VKRPFVILIAIALPLLLAPAAQAKGPVEKIQVCGDESCAAVPITPGRGVGRPEGLGMLMGNPASQVPAPQPYVNLNVTLGLGEGTIKMFYVPGAQVAFSQGWSQLPPGLGAKLDAAAARVAKHEPKLAVVVVGKRTSSDPGAYVSLLSPLEPAHAPGSLQLLDASTVGIRFTTTGITPWTPRGDGYATYLPSAHLIGMNNDWFAPSAALDSQIRRDAAAVLAAPAVSSGGPSPWWLVLPAAGAGAGLPVLIMRRRRAQPRTVPVA
jgi:hypothetical protein